MTHRLNVLINAAILNTPLSGIGRYTRQLSQGLENHPEINDVKYFFQNDRGKEKSFFSNAIKSLQNEQGHMRYISGVLNKLPYMRVWMDNVLDYCTQQQRNRYKDYIYHEPSFVAKRFSGKTIVTVHDLSIYHYPQHHPKHRVRYVTAGLERSLSRANHFITVSNYVRDEVIQQFNVKPEQVTAIYNGVSPNFAPYSEVDVTVTLNKYQLPFKRYVLIVGSFEPRKNLVKLFKAYEQLPEREKKQFPLVHVGPSGWLNHDMEQRVECLSRKGFFRKLGYIPDHELPFLYAGARGLAYPSIYEGFGLPILEGMASGLPVLAANTSAMPEVLGDVGLLIDPYDINQLKQGLEQLLTDESFRSQARQQGPERARLFSWDRCINETVAVYKKLAL